MHKLTQHFLTEFERNKATFPGARLPWLQKSREEAIAFFAQAKLPSRQDEAWKYTTLDKWTESFLACRGAAYPENQTLILEKDFAEKVLSQDCYQLTFVDGVFHAELSVLPAASSQWILQNLSMALAEHPAKVESYLNSLQVTHAFAALNAAFWQEGLFLELSANTVMDKPIVLNVVSTQAEQFHHLRNLIIAQPGARATIIEHYYDCNDATDNTYFNNVLSQLIVADNACIDHYKIQQEGALGLHIGATIVDQQRDSQVNSHVFSFGAALGRNDIHVNLNAENATCHLYGLYLAKDKQHLDHYTRIEHLKSRGTSKEYYKGIVDNQARAIFNGLVYVAPQAQKTSAEQQNKNLLLSRLAEVDTRPQLEIYADDVKCTHGATVGQLDEDVLFYLRTRGLDAEVAQALLIRAFAAEIIAQVALPALRTKLEEMLLEFRKKAE